LNKACKGSKTHGQREPWTQTGTSVSLSQVADYIGQKIITVYRASLHFLKCHMDLRYPLLKYTVPLKNLFRVYCVELLMFYRRHRMTDGKEVRTEVHTKQSAFPPVSTVLKLRHDYPGFPGEQRVQSHKVTPGTKTGVFPPRWGVGVGGDFSRNSKTTKDNEQTYRSLGLEQALFIKAQIKYHHTGPLSVPLTDLRKS
ncbi:hypothetical protein STEG23_019461, partial [Scotinomys teguina]